MEEIKTCPVCGDKIRGRIDKKFCSDQCRNSFNNQQNTFTNKNMQMVNSILRKNRRILEELNPEGKTTLNRSKMLEKGFDFQYFTSIYRTKSENTYYFCYEQGYLPIENNLVALVRKKEWL